MTSYKQEINYIKVSYSINLDSDRHSNRTASKSFSVSPSPVQSRGTA